MTAVVSKPTTTTTGANKRPPRTKKPRVSFKRIIAFVALLLTALVALAAFVPTTRWAAATGYLMTDSEAELRPSVEGNIAEWLVRSGQPVEAGDVVMRLEDSLQRTALEQARAEVQTRRALLQRTRTQFEFEDSQIAEQVRRLEQRLKAANDRLTMLVESGPGAFSPTELDAARLEVSLITSQLDELRLPREKMRAEQLAVLQDQIAAAEKAAAVHEAEIALRQVRTPVEGAVYFNRFETGEMVKPEDVLGQVFDRRQWVVKLKLTERQIAHVEVGQEVEVALAPYPTLRYGTLRARVSRILPVVTPQATGDGIFYVEAALEAPEGLQLQPGMSANASIDTGRTTWLLRILGW